MDINARSAVRLDEDADVRRPAQLAVLGDRLVDAAPRLAVVATRQARTVDWSAVSHDPDETAAPLARVFRVCEPRTVRS